MPPPFEGSSNFLGLTRLILSGMALATGCGTKYLPTAQTGG